MVIESDFLSSNAYSFSEKLSYIKNSNEYSNVAFRAWNIFKLIISCGTYDLQLTNEKCDYMESAHNQSIFSRKVQHLKVPSEQPSVRQLPSEDEQEIAKNATVVKENNDLEEACKKLTDDNEKLVDAHNNRTIENYVLRMKDYMLRIENEKNRVAHLKEEIESLKIQAGEMENQLLATTIDSNDNNNANDIGNRYIQLQNDIMAKAKTVNFFDEETIDVERNEKLMCDILKQSYTLASAALLKSTEAFYQALDLNDNSEEIKVAVTKELKALYSSTAFEAPFITNIMDGLANKFKNDMPEEKDNINAWQEFFNLCAELSYHMVKCYYGNSNSSPLVFSDQNKKGDAFDKNIFAVHNGENAQRHQKIKRILFLPMIRANEDNAIVAKGLAEME